MSLNDRVWLLFNKRAGKAFASYFGVVLPWAAVGFLLTISALFFTSVASSWSTIVPSFGFWTVCVVLLIIPVLLAGSFYYFDKRWGYLDVIHTHYLKRREERIKKLENR